jgi:hypothetical protein
MIGIAIANSLGLKLSGINPDAQAFITAAGITGTTQVDAVNALVNGLQTDGLWSKMKAVYPFVTDNRNLLGYTEFLGNLSVWTRTNTTVTNNSTTAPNGTLTADTITSNSSVVASLNQLNLANSAGTYTQSFYIKQGSGGPSAVLYLNDGTTSNYSAAWFNLVTGTLLTVTSVGTFSGASSAITNEGNGWYRCSLTFTKPSTANSSFSISISPDNSFATNTGSEIFAWGAQLEVGTLTAYQPITTTTQAYIANQFKFNLVNPVNSDAAFRLVFNGGWTHSSNGATPNGTNGYANTNLNQSANLAPSNNHISFYSRTSVTNVTNQIDCGVTNNTSYSFSQLSIAFGGTFKYENGSQTPTSTFTNTLGLFLGTSIISNRGKLYKNGTPTSSSVIDQTRTMFSNNIYLAATNISTTNLPAGVYGSKQLAFSSIGDGLTDTEASNLYTRVQTYQTALSRNV